MFTGGLLGNPTDLDNISIPPYSGNKPHSTDLLEDQICEIDKKVRAILPCCRTVTSKLDTPDSRLDALDALCQTVSDKVSTVDVNVITIDSKVDIMTINVSTLISKVDEMLPQYYELRGWSEKGEPTPETLEVLGLGGE